MHSFLGSTAGKRAGLIPAGCRSIPSPVLTVLMMQAPVKDSYAARMSPPDRETRNCLVIGIGDHPLEESDEWRVVDPDQSVLYLR